MASVRLAQLLAQRQANKNLYSGNKIRLLSPQNNGIASIAKAAASGELDIMVSRYNNGEVANEEMRSFLTKMSTSVGLSNSDKLDVQNQIRDFDSRIVKDKLEASYKAAPDGSFQQLQAAQAIASYYQQRASTQAEGTPAQSQTLQSAADWNAKTVDIKTSMAKVASQNLRYQEELKVNQLPNNSSERATQKAEMYKQLYEKAVADGDSVGASKYAAYYEQQLTTADELATKEYTTGEKTEIRNLMGNYVDMYHDGRITESQYLQLLADLSPRIDATNDYGLINALNRTTDTIQKNLDKGGLKRGTTASGLPTVLGKNKGGSGSGVATDWDQQDFDYSDNLRKFKKAFEDGDIDAATYSDAVGQAVVKHANDVSANIATLEEQAQLNPNAKIMFNGKKTKISDALDSLTNEYEDIKGQAQAVEKGNFAFVEVPPGEFNKSGGVGSGKSFATYKPIDLANAPKDQYAQDTEGILHFIDKETRPLTLEEQANVYNGTLAIGDKIYKVKTDTSGNQELETGNPKIKVYKPGTSEYKFVGADEKGITPSWTNAANMAQQDKDTAAYLKKKETQKQELIKQRAAAPIKDVNGNPLSLTGLPQKPVDIKTAINSGGLTIDAKQPVKPKQPAAPSVIAAARPLPAEKLGITPDMRVSMPQSTVVPQTGNAYQATKMPTLKLATQAPSPVAQLAKANNIAPKPIAAPPKIAGLPSYQNVGKQDYSVMGSLKALANPILKLFGGGKK